MAAAPDDPLVFEPPTLSDIREAAGRINGSVAHTPLMHSRTLSAMTGAEIYLKFENLQFTASFKERGALNRLLQLNGDQRRQGVIAMSAGNHAQGVAYHAGQLNIPATIVMPADTPFIKVQHTEDFGARVILAGQTLAEAAEHAHELRHAEQLTFIHPYADPAIIAGQGTVALEILNDLPHCDAIVVPVGGGGLLAGISLACTELRPQVELVAVEAAAYPALHQAVGHIGESEPVPTASTATGTGNGAGNASGSTVAEGIAVKDIGPTNLKIVRDRIKHSVVVAEEELEEAVNLLASIEKTVVEGAGAAALAAVRKHPALFAGKTTALILSGGNIDSRLLASILMRSLVRNGRIARLRIEITDSPGALARVATEIARGGGNIIEVSHQRMFGQMSVKNAHLNVALETRDKKQIDAIVARLTDAGMPVRRLN